MTRRSVRPKGGDRKRGRALRVLLGAAAALVILPVIAHLAVVRAARLDPPRIDAPALGGVMTSGSVRRLGRAYVRRVERLLEVRLVGSPEAIGTAHSRILYEDMIATEGSVWELLDGLVPSRAAQVALLDLAQWRYRNVASGVAGPRLREIAAAARGFDPDPFADRFDTFQRFMYLSALYDISLAFEHSPLIGCTTFVFSGAAGGAPLLARAFDFEAHPVFDERKAVFLVLEDGKIPYASVAWPGLVGVVSGMNAEGLAVVVHGARAGSTRTVGEPVVHALRRVLGTARTTQEAISALDTRDAMVSHIVVVVDALGHAAAVERIPDRPAHVRALGSRAVVTNHLEGPAAGDPKNEQVRQNTSTLARRARGDELLKGATGSVTEEDAVRLLRDRKGAGGRPLPLGDRRAIDALIATHGVVVNTRERVLWVSQSPHLLGSFVAFELNELLRRDYEPGPDAPRRRSIEADPLLKSGQPLPRARGVPSRDASR